MTGADRGATALCFVLAAGALSGVGSKWVFARFGDAGALRTATNRILAHLLEFRLFADEPRLIVRAQRDLLRANALFLRLAIVPSLILLVPFGALLAAADALCGHAPLMPGQTSTVTVRYSAQAAVALRELQLKAPAGLQVETPPIRISRTREVSWRVRAVRSASGDLEVRIGDRTIRKAICARPGVHWISDRRIGFPDVLFHPSEIPLTGSEIEAITVQYSSGRIFHFHWLFWFVIGSLTGLLLPNVT